MTLIRSTWQNWYQRRKRRAALAASRFGLMANQYFLASYPKSGNTWVRMFLANLLDPAEIITLKSVGRYIPDTHVEAQMCQVFDRTSAFYRMPVQIVKVHDPYSEFFADKRVVYVVRDGRDALTSYYHYLNARRARPVTLDTVIRGGADPFGRWSSHVRMWKKGSCARKMIIRYEDLLRDPQKEFMRLLDFMKISPRFEDVRAAIERSSFRNLQRLECEHGGIHPVKSEGANAAFFRKGKAGDWREVFNEVELATFWRIHTRGMHAFGYDKHIPSEVHIS